jgi:hypothetical protein
MDRADGRSAQEICLQVGYRYQEVGRPSAQTMTVVVRGQNRPAYELLEDIAWQAQPLALCVSIPSTEPLRWQEHPAGRSGHEQ